MVTTYSVDVYRLQLARQFQNGGQAYRWLDKVRLAMHSACVRNAPSRTGALAGSHRSFIRGVNQYRARAEVVNSAEHALWVHEGTTGPIYPEDSDFLWVPIRRGSAARTKRAYVNGQASQPWMDDACSRIARRNGGISVG